MVNRSSYPGSPMVHKMSWLLKKRYRELIAPEKGCPPKARGDQLSVCLAYPNAYRTGMANLGFQTVFALINSHQAFYCERAFLPDPGDEVSFIPGSTPLFSLESQKPLKDFDIVAFSISFENDYPHILKMLDMAGIPLLARDRHQGDPLMVGGGIAVTLNPEPLSDFFDLFLLGEGEEMIVDFLDAYDALARSGASREDALLRIQRDIEGAYVPALYRVSYRADGQIEKREPADLSLPEKIRKRWVRNIDAFLTEQCITAPGSEFGNMHLTEVSRGCRRGCRFCAAGFVYRPARFRSAATLVGSFVRGIEGKRKIGLLGTAVSDHPELAGLCQSILDRKGRAAIGSLRLDRMDSRIAALLKRSGVETVALAPEAGTQRLRDVIHKGVTEEQILTAAGTLASQGILKIKLYFMVGLPTERPEDIEAIIHLTRRIRDHALQCCAGKRPLQRVTLSINQFIPKAATPFQWHSLEDVRAVRKKIRRIEEVMRRELLIHVTHDLPKWNLIQALLSLGDRRVGQLLLSVHVREGNWRRALKEAAIPAEFYVYRPKENGEILPWDFIEHGVSRDFLWQEYRKALS